MQNPTDKLYNFLQNFLYDLAFWYVFSVDREFYADHFVKFEKIVNGKKIIKSDYVDENENPVSNIYESKHHFNQIFCLHAIEFFDKYCGVNLTEINPEKQIENNQLYSIYADIGKESHGFIVLRAENMVGTINFYGGEGRTFVAENYFEDFNIFWGLLNRSKEFPRDDHHDNLVNSNFSIITGIDGLYPPYYLETIKVKKININEKVVNKIIQSCISALANEFRPYFKGRQEEKIIYQTIIDMQRWID